MRSTHQLLRTRLPQCLTVDPTHRIQLIKRRAVVKASLTRLRNFIVAGEKINDIQVRFN